MSEVTAFLVCTSNNPNYDLCIEALKKQTIDIEIDVIRDYYPMSKAFQEMLNRCKTSYYIEVDDDMILQPDACEKMLKAVKQTNDRISMVGFQLRDVHLDFIIYGVKIYKYDIFKRYPYDLNHMSCEVEQLERMKADGITYQLIREVVGDHSPLWTTELIFQRYLNLMEKYKEFKYSWLEFVPNKLFKIFQNDPSIENLYALFGAYTSIIGDKVQVGEKDFRNYRRKEIEKMRTYLEPPNQATLYMTSRCNFKCRYCMRQHQGIENAPDMSVSVVENLLERFPDMKGICLCGFGEPLMCENFDAILEFLHGKNLTIGLITNGSKLVDKIDVIKKFPPTYISVSMNAADAARHKEEVGVQSYGKVVNGIKKVLATKIPLHVSHICSKDNWVYVPEFLSSVKNLGVTSVHLHNLLPHFDNSHNKDFWDLVLTTDDAKMVELVQRLPGSEIVKRWPVLINKNEIRRDCFFPWKQIGVDGNGSITVCGSVEPPHSSRGNINQENIWHNDYCEDLRCSVLGEQKEMCKRCFRNWKCD